MNRITLVGNYEVSRLPRAISLLHYFRNSWLSLIMFLRLADSHYSQDERESLSVRLTCCMKKSLIFPIGNDPAFLSNVRRALEEALLAARAVCTQRYQAISVPPTPILFSCHASLSKQSRMSNHFQS